MKGFKLVRHGLLPLLGLCILAAVIACAWVWNEWRDINTRTLNTEQERMIQVERGESLMGLMRRLEAEGLIADARPVRIWSRLTDQGRQIRAGEYRLTPQMTIPDLVQKLEKGEVVLHRFTLVEGWTFKQLREALSRHDAIKQTIDGLDDEAVMSAIGSEALHPEGWFLPETYSFPRGTTDIALLSQAHDRMQEALETIWADRDAGLPLETPYEALILASIIERETGAQGERAKVAGVFIRRLREGMRLQTDPTVIYGLEDGEYQGRLRYRHLRTDTPYNTYTRHGLTPTPIAMPGKASLVAAVQPEIGDYLYFVSRNDGSHHFSGTLREHNRAVRKYQLGEDIELDSNND